jgi:RNA polymerase sigma-70 factor, ECF subfamily
MWAMAEKTFLQMAKFYGTFLGSRNLRQEMGFSNRGVKYPSKHPNLHVGMLGLDVWSVKQPESACCRHFEHLILSVSWWRPICILLKEANHLSFTKPFYTPHKQLKVALSNLDRELLRDCLVKAPQAWENLSDRFLGLVVHIVNHSAGARGVHMPPELRDDLVADVFVSWIDRDFAILRRFRGQSSLATYLAVVSRRVVLRRLSQLRLPQSQQSIEALKLDPTDPETNSYTREEFEQLSGSIDKLSQNEAQAVRMFHLDGKSYSEIGSHIGMPENSVGPFLSRAREKIRRSV